MKILTTLLATVVSFFFAGSSISAPALPADPPNMGASSALMKALKSSQAEMLSGEDQGVTVIFVQPRDAESTVRNVEALDTLYFLTRQTIWVGEDEDEIEIGLTLVFEVDKTSNALRLLRYRQIEGWWIGAEPYHPSDLPDIDFQEAYRLVKEQAGKDKPIARIGISYAAVEGYPLIVDFYLKAEGLPEGICEQWVYVYDSGSVEPHLPAGCYFNLDSFGTD